MSSYWNYASAENSVSYFATSHWWQMEKIIRSIIIQHFQLLRRIPDVGKPSVHLHMLPVEQFCWVSSVRVKRYSCKNISLWPCNVFKFCSPCEGISSFLCRSSCSSPSLLSSSPLRLINTSSHVLQVCRSQFQQSLRTVASKRAQHSSPAVLLMGFVYYIWYIS